jgi:hypothetical protein
MSETGAGPGMDFLFEKVPSKSVKGKSEEGKPVLDKTEQRKTEEGISDQIKTITDKSVKGISETDKSEVGNLEQGISDQGKSAIDKTEEGIIDTGISEENKPLPFDNVNQDNLASIKSLKVKIIRESVEVARSRKQRIAVWSPAISATMWYLKSTTPMFSISDEARVLIEEGLEKKYPELFKRIKDEMRK